MTFIEASIEVLKANNNKPMKPREIWSEIEKRGLVKTSGKTPWASLNTILLYHSKPEYKKKIYFDIASISPLRFTIHNFNSSEKIESIDIEYTNEKVLLYQITSKELGWKKLSLFNKNENIEYEISECEEYTYIMEDKAHDTIKIGKTKNDPEVRLNQLKTGNPSIILLHVFPSSLYSESDLHSRFNDYQKNLEWFYYAKGLRTFIDDEIKKSNSILNSYKLKIDLDKVEKAMLNNL